MKPHLLFTLISLFVASTLFAQSDSQPWIGTWKVINIDTKTARESMQQSLKKVSHEEGELIQMGYEMIEESVLENVSKLYFKLNEDRTYKAFMPDFALYIGEDSGTYKMNFPFTLEFNSKSKDENSNTFYFIISATPTELVLQEKSFKLVITLQRQ